MSADPQDFDRVLSSMCTRPCSAARDAAERFLATNPGDPKSYPTIAALESEVVGRLGGIAGLDGPYGYVTSGGTEANIQATRIARENANTPDPNVIVPESVHFSFRKAASLLAVELRTIPTDENGRADLAALRARIDNDTALVVGVAGTTEYGRVDPIVELARIAKNHGALVHVDAAWGGFYLPFTDHEWSFEHAPIDMMTIDPHKLGQAAIPAGGLLVRNRTHIDALAIETPYLESASQWSLTGTRSGAGVASAAAAIEALWPNGYEAAHEQATANAEWIARALREREYGVIDPDMPLVAASVPNREFEALRDSGWRISRTEAGETRITCMPHVTRGMLRAFVADLDRIR